MITKKLSKTTWAFDPTALDGKGYWFVYGKNGALGRAATQEEARQLGTPSKDEIYPQDDAEKVKSEEPANENMSDEEREEMLHQDALRRNKRSRYYGKLTQTSSKYEQANIVRGKSFGQIVSERMLRGEGGREALKGAAGEKIGAIGMGIKEKFDPIRLLNKVPVLGGALATMYGMKKGRDAADISYFTGAGRFIKQQPTPGVLGRQAGDEDSGLASKVTTSVSQRMGTATKVGREMASGVPQKNINNIKTVLGAMKKLYALERIWYDEEKKNRAEDKKEKEIAANFKEEQEMERQRELLKALTGKDTKLGKKEKPKKEESKGFFGWLKDMFENFLGFKLIDGILSIMKTGIMGMLRGAATLLAPVLGLLGEAIIPVIAVIGALALAMKGITWLISKFTGKPMDYLDKNKEFDNETTPKDVQKDYETIGHGKNNMAGNAMDDKRYEQNKKILASDKPVPGFYNGSATNDMRPYAQKQNDAYDRVQKFKGSNDPLQTYRREVEAGHVKRETSFEDWKKEQGNTGALDAEGKPLTRNLRNNNPGNIRFEKGGFAEKHGATGADDKGFAIFPSMDAGEQAQKDLLFKSDSYKNKTLDQAVSRYAPSSENNTGAYQKSVQKSLGKSYDPNKKMSEYSPEDQQKIMTGFQKMEGGTVEGYKSAQQNKPTATKLTESYQAKLSGVTQDQIEKNPNYKKYLAQAKEMGDTQDEAEDYATELVYADMAKSANKLAPVNKLTPVAKADELSNRMNNSVSENKNLTSMTNQPQVTPPIMMNTTNNIMNKGGNSASIAPTPIRNDEPMLLRSQYGVVRTV